MLSKIETIFIKFSHRFQRLIQRVL
jgi:hypothetical protein